MTKRGMLLGTYNTALKGWTLVTWKLSDPVYDQNFIKISGSSVILDMSDALTDGEPTYNQRTLTATFECSEGTRADRLALVDEMVNRLDGRRVNIMLPDDAEHYLTGRLSVMENYNDLAHASVTVTALCDPWRYAYEQVELTLVATSTEQVAELTNVGRQPVTPTITITGGEMSLEFGTEAWTLSPGTYDLPGLILKPGENNLTYSGSGTAAVVYREAIL